MNYTLSESTERQLWHYIWTPSKSFSQCPALAMQLSVLHAIHHSCAQREETQTGKIRRQHIHPQNKNNSIFSKDAMKANCMNTELCADIFMCRSVLLSILPVTGHTGALTVSQHYLTTTLLKLLGEPVVMVGCTALTDNKTSCQDRAVGTAFLSNRSTHLKHK